MSFPRELEQAIRDAESEVTDSTHVTMFFLRRTGSKFDDKKYEVVTVEVEGEVADDLREVFSNRMKRLVKDLDEENVEFKDFFDENIKPKHVSEVKDTLVPVLPFIREKMKDDGLVTIHSLAHVKEFDAYAVEFHLPSGHAIYFRKIGLAQLITKKFDLAYILQEGKFNKVEDDIVAFDKQIDCVYFDKTKSLLVLNKYDVEVIFGIREYYQAQSQITIQELVEKGLIVINEGTLIEVLADYHITRRITRLSKEGKFDREIQFFSDHAKYFDSKKPVLKEDEVQLTIRDNKVVIDNKEQLETFLKICDDDYVEGVVSGVSYVSDSKEKLSK